jgi:hypothetical protein
LGGTSEGVESDDAVAGGGGDVRTDGAEDLGTRHRAHASGDLDAQLCDGAAISRLGLSRRWRGGFVGPALRCLAAFLKRVREYREQRAEREEAEKDDE